MIDKSIRADYAIQGGGPNYLGKQKMVKAPKKWQSSPDHDPAELAYITKKEKDILIALDVHGSLKDGKPNRGPSGIISLQGDLGGYGGSGGSSGGGGGGNGSHDRGGWQHHRAAAPAPAPEPDRQDRARQQAAVEKAVAEQRATEQRAEAEQQAAAQRDMQATIAQAERAEANRVAQQAAEGKIDVGFQEALKKTADARQREEEFLETGDLDVLTDLTGFDTAPKVDVKDIMGEVDDPGSVSYDPTIEQQKTILEDPRVDEGFKRYIRQVQQPIVSTDRTGLMQSFMDTGPKIDVKDAIGRGVFNVGLKKLGLGMLNPFLGLASLFTRGRTPRSAYDLAKNLKSNIQTPSNVIDTRTSAIDTKPDREGRVDMQPKEKPTTVAETITTGAGLESGQKMLGLDQRQELTKRRNIVQGILEQGSYQGRVLTNQQKNNLMNYIEQINKFLVPVAQGI